MLILFTFIMYLLTNTSSIYSLLLLSHRITIKSSRSLRTSRPPQASKSRMKATDKPDVLPVVEVINKTRRKIDTEKVAEQVKIILEILGRSDFGVDVEFCSDDRIRRLNADWRGKGRPTDVLSFTNFEFESPEVFSRASQQVFRFNRQLGEIVIAPQYVLQQCREDKKDYEIGMQTAEGRTELQAEWESDAGCSRAMSTLFTLKERTPLLVVHSLLHLLGYDHETEDDWRAMTTREDEVIQQYYQHIQQQQQLQAEQPQVGNLGKEGECSDTTSVAAPIQ